MDVSFWGVVKILINPLFFHKYISNSVKWLIINLLSL